MDRSNIVDRAAEISEIARSLATVLAKTGQPEPSFEHGLPDALRSDAPDSDAGAIASRMKLIGLLDEFRDLLIDPAMHLSPEGVSRMVISGSKSSYSNFRLSEIQP